MASVVGERSQLKLLLSVVVAGVEEQSLARLF